MKRLILTFTLLLLAQQTYADSYTYISPERYAVNEADFIDYTRIAPPRPLNVDTLEDDRFQAPNLVEKDFEIGKDNSDQQDKVKSKKNKKAEKEELEPYQKKLSYKLAKWWVDQRYKREEPHHGALHEIKVEKRMQYEAQEQAKQAQQTKESE